jgi:hypothetical protein
MARSINRDERDNYTSELPLGLQGDVDVVTFTCNNATAATIGATTGTPGRVRPGISQTISFASLDQLVRLITTNSGLKFLPE